MSKRKITNHQKRRIDTKQSQQIELDKLQGGEQEGVVIAHYGKRVELETASGDLITCHKRQHLGGVVAGDRVLWQVSDADTVGVVEAVLPRNSFISRPSARGEPVAVAANIDTLFIVVAPVPEPHLTTIDRYLISAELSEIKPIILLNKSDLLTSSLDKTDVGQRLQLYRALGYQVLEVSAFQAHNIDSLKEMLCGNNSIFVGQSGVGKSSLISCLLPGYDIKIGKISDKSKQGRHTTTAARLYRLNDIPGNIIDSPGIREFPLYNMDALELSKGFVEFRELSQACKYRNCQHLQEQGCAVQEAADAGKISMTRLNSYRSILQDLKEKFTKKY